MKRPVGDVVAAVAAVFLVIVFAPLAVLLGWILWALLIAAITDVPLCEYLPSTTCGGGR